MQLRLGGLPRSLDRLAAEKDVLADLGYPWLESQLGVTIAGRDIDVVDAVSQGEGAIGHVLLHPSDTGGAECHHAAHVPGPSKTSLVHVISPRVRAGGPSALRRRLSRQIVGEDRSCDLG